MKFLSRLWPRRRQQTVTAWRNIRNRLAAGAADSKPQRKLTLADIDALVDAMDSGNGEPEVES